MAYVKLDCGMLDSTIWVDREAREVFITALLMAVPYKLLSPTPQIAVRSLEPTGWIIPPGDYGIIEAAGVGIVRRAMVDTEAGLDALERMGEPEAESRSPKYDGRRLVRIAGGYLALNYWDYRNRDGTSAERQRRFREKHNVTRNRDDITRDITPRNVSNKQDAIRNTETTPTAVRVRQSPSDDLDFIAAWEAYPRRAGGNPRPAALRAWKARRAEGIPAADLLAGVARYAAFIRATEGEGTRFVKQAATFFGPDRHWADNWLPDTPKVKLTTGEQSYLVGCQALGVEP